jgi:DNA-3-methyladenine glycosylase II
MGEVRVARKAALEPRIIQDPADIEEGLRYLRRRCAIMRKAHKMAGLPPLRRTRPGFEGLARIVVGQQLSVASAAAIWSRTCAAIAPFEAKGFLAASETELRACGLSGGKIRTLRAIAKAVEAGEIDFAALEAAGEDEVKDRLTAIHGVGPWTADIYLMFCMGRADSFAPGDLALQEAVRMALQLDQRPTAAEITAIAEAWRPWRAVAAGMLWAYYKAAAQLRSGAPV